ncbi:MAG TPA: NADH-quinone oxidoreductase subunit C [Syntrophobacteraceae bacterium]|nr:NADH-quinone oxidoreductase subunit C [Syntrophobacteraceae bacterium]
MKVKDIEGVMRSKFPDAPLHMDESGLTGALWSMAVPISGIRDAAGAFDAAGFFLESITALDFEDTFELVYHFNCYEPMSRVVVRVLCGHGQVPPSICDIYRGAVWLEREVHDFFGIEFSGNPDMRPLLLPEDADYHPLRKTFGKVGAYHKREVIYG